MEIDPDGDAAIDFDEHKREQWVLKQNFHCVQCTRPKRRTGGARAPFFW